MPRLADGFSRAVAVPVRYLEAALLAAYDRAPGHPEPARELRLLDPEGSPHGAHVIGGD
jgi:hypothetical protein